MTTTTESNYSEAQITAWLRGLLTIAWADGDFDDDEKQLFVELTTDVFASSKDPFSLETISPEELASGLGKDKDTGENFLRTAVMMAVADGFYSPPEKEVIEQFCDALGLKIEALKSLETTLEDPNDCQQESISPTGSPLAPPLEQKNALTPVKDWLDGMDVKDPKIARFICKMIPSQCPFERDITLFGKKLVHIPPMCKINPLYEQLVGLRFRSLSFLADKCGEDVSPYL